VWNEQDEDVSLNTAGLHQFLLLQFFAEKYLLMRSWCASLRTQTFSLSGRNFPFLDSSHGSGVSQDARSVSAGGSYTFLGKRNTSISLHSVILFYWGIVPPYRSLQEKQAAATRARKHTHTRPERILFSNRLLPFLTCPVTSWQVKGIPGQALRVPESWCSQISK